MGRVAAIPDSLAIYGTTFGKGKGERRTTEKGKREGRREKKRGTYSNGSDATV